jgi:ABC-type branched-subunit amino acid transport system substrate-binding protein
VAIGGGVFSLGQISYSSTAAALSDKNAYPYFTRMVPSDSKQGRAFAEFVSSHNWGTFVSAISSSDDYGVGGVREFINAGASIGVNVTTYQQFLVGAKDISVEMRELSRSGSRVFLAFLLASDAINVFLAADDIGIVGDAYVWLCSDGCAQTSLFTNATDGSIRQDVRKATKGLVGLAPKGGSGPLYDSFIQQWSTLDPVVYPGSGKTTINLFAPHAYDCVYAWAYVFQTLLAAGKFPPYDGPTSFETIINSTFTGLTGDIRFETNGNRLARYDVLNLQSNDTVFTVVGSWSEILLELDNSTHGFNYTEKIEWHSGSTRVPDLDLRTPFHYWQCHEKERGYDPTGKLIDLTTPDASDPDFIASHYYCDQYLDCNNMSDEPFDCTPSYTATFVAFGIITGLLILTLPVFAAFTIAFGCIWQKRRIRLLSPVFLLGMCVAALFGYCSTFAWYGKPQVVACNFQSWLLGLSVNLMIS